MNLRDSLALISFCLVASAVADPGPYTGKYSGTGIDVEFTSVGTGYNGTIHSNNQDFPLIAGEVDGVLNGMFKSRGHDVEFTAKLAGDQLTMVVANTEYVLKKQMAAGAVPVNPLAKPADSGAAPVNPLARPADANDAPVNPLAKPAEAGAVRGAVQNSPVDALPTAFEEIGVTGSGRAVTARFANAKTVDEAIQQTGDALGKIFDGKPQFDGASVDSKSKSRGIASFAGSLKGKEIKGIVLFSIDSQTGAMVNVVYSRTDAPASEVGALMAALPQNVPMQTFRFPDGSGTIDLPRGWKVDGTSATDFVRVLGPENQIILNHMNIIVGTTNGAFMQQYRANLARMRQMGPNAPTPPPPPGPIFDYMSPADVLKTVFPSIHEKQRRAGQGYIAFGELITSANADGNPLIPGSEAGVFYFHTVRHTGANGSNVIPYREMYRIDTARIGDGKDYWNFFTSGFAAPEETFERDLPLMKDIIATFRLDPDALRQKGIRDQKQVDAMLAEGQRQHENLMARGRAYQQEQNEHFNRMQANDQARRQARHDANSDFIEMIGGYRTVLNTATGTTQSVNYYQVNQITNAWNTAANNPNQFVQIPLRYQR